MGLCVVCLGELGGQRWRYCSDTCNNRNSSRDLRARLNLQKRQLPHLPARQKTVGAAKIVLPPPDTLAFFSRFTVQPGPDGRVFLCFGNNGHGIAITEKTVPFLDGFLVALQDSFSSGQGGYQEQQR